MNRIAIQSGTISILSAIGQAVGFALVALLAARFGASVETDAFFLALAFPALVATSSTVAIQSVFIPLFVEQQRGDPSAFNFFVGTTLLVLGGASFLIAGATFIAAPWLLSVSGHATARTVDLSTDYLRILALMIPLQILAAVLAAVLNSREHFWLSPVAFIVRYLSTIAVIWYGSDAFGGTVIPMAFLAGCVFQLLVLVSGWPLLGITIAIGRTDLSPIRKGMILALPLLGGMILLQMTALLVRFIAAGLPEGSVSIYDYAARISSAVTELLTSGVMVVLLTDWAKVSSNDRALARKLRQTTLFLLFLVLPITAVLLVLREPIVILAFQRGEFDTASAQLTALVLIPALLAIPVDIIGRTYTRLFLVWHRTSILALTAVLRLGTVAAFALFSVSSYGLVALTLADALSTVVALVLLVALANLRLGNTLSGLFGPILKLAFATLLASATTLFVGSTLSEMPLVVAISLAAACGGGIYLVCACILRFREMSVLGGLIRRIEQ